MFPGFLTPVLTQISFQSHQLLSSHASAEVFLWRDIIQVLPNKASFHHLTLHKTMMTFNAPEKTRSLPRDNLFSLHDLDLWPLTYLNETFKWHFYSLTLSKTTIFCLLQTETVCRRQFLSWWIWQRVLQTSRKHCGKRSNCSLRAISPFLTVFSKDVHGRHVKSRTCLRKGLGELLCQIILLLFYYYWNA